MDFLKLIKNRYSCRAYEPRNVEKEKLDYVFECVRFAPSAVNRQPWRFRIVESDADRTLLQRCYNREWFTSAPLYVIASVLHDEEWVRTDGKAHGDIDIAIAVEHLCLLLPSKDWAPAGCAISMLHSASNSSHSATTKSQPCSFPSAILPTNPNRRNVRR